MKKQYEILKNKINELEKRNELLNSLVNFYSVLINLANEVVKFEDVDFDIDFHIEFWYSILYKTRSFIGLVFFNHFYY